MYRSDYAFEAHSRDRSDYIEKHRPSVWEVWFGGVRVGTHTKRADARKHIRALKKKRGQNGRE